MIGDQYFELAREAIGFLGGAFDVAGKTVDGISNIATTAITSMQNVKIQKLQNEIQKFEMAHTEEMQKIQNMHDEKMLSMKLEHEKFLITEQRKVINKMIAAATAAYEKKIDLIKARMQCLNETYTKEAELLDNHISYLEAERRQCMNDANMYVLISSDIKNMMEKKSTLYNDYLLAQGKLDDAMEYLRIDEKFGTAIPCGRDLLIGGK